MKFAPAILFAILLLSANSTGIMYLTSGTDSYGKGLSYPGYKSPPTIASLLARDHTSSLAPVFLGATLYRPEFANISSINRSYYNQFIDTRWHYYRPFPNHPDWSALGMERDIHVLAVMEFVQEDWEPPELSKENYPGINEFLESGEDAPRRPLI